MRIIPGTLFAVSVLAAFLIFDVPTHAGSPLAGKTIALDAGHTAEAWGATGYCGGTAVKEVDVNLAVRALLAEKIVNEGGGTAHLVLQLDSRSDRVSDAESAGSDVLISIHHNGSSNTSADYVQSFVTQKNDKVFASYIHPKIVEALAPLSDKGIKNDGYGMTVYGSLPGVLTESYFITNTAAACDFLAYLGGAPGTRVEREAQAMFDGLNAYFSRSTGGGGGSGKGRNK